MKLSLGILHIKKTFEQIWNDFQHDSLFQNSIYIFASTGVISFLGFLFWFFAAHHYSSYDVGLAGTIISACSLIVSLSSLGIANAFIRFIPTSENKQEIINSGVILVFGSTILFTLGYLFLLPFFSPKLSVITHYPLLTLLFVFLTVFASLANLIDSIFISLRTAHFNLATYSVFGIIKLGAVLLLSIFGTAGLVLSHTFGLFCSVFLGYYLIQQKLHLSFRIQFNKKTVHKMLAFSLITYLTTFAAGMPSFLLPLIILHALGASSVAYFYMAMMIATLIFAVPNSVASSLFAEGSHNTDTVDAHFKRSILAIFSSLIGINTVIVLFGHQILAIFGKEYSIQGYWPLVLLCFSSFFLAINSLFSTILKIRQQLMSYLIINIIGAVCIVLGSFFTVTYGLMYVSLSWLVGQILMSICFFIDYKIGVPSKLFSSRA